MPALNKLCDEYRDRVAFFVVYVMEAHTSDGWQMQSNVRDNVIFSRPRNYQERASLAQTCVHKLEIKFPALVDDFNNSTEKAYTGWPDRIYLINSEGEIAYKGNLGPFGFKPVELSDALAKLARN